MLPNPVRQTELFHLLFTRHLGEKIDRSLFVLKGGCNLRFFFKSIRYSEDIDFDVKTVAKATLKSQITRLLESAPFLQVLRTRRLEITDISSPKQTETTQRWKLKVLGPASSTPVPTKIEFSRRGVDEGYAYAPVDPELIGSHGLYPVLCTHYLREAAFAQKVSALVHRAATQARDVFDLDLLLQALREPPALPMPLRSKLDQAIENCAGIAYEDYRSQVVSYLAPEHGQYFGSRETWDRMQEKLIAALESLKRGAAS